VKYLLFVALGGAGGAVSRYLLGQVVHPDWRGVLMVGFLGAFTTFSTFSLETIGLMEAGHIGHALAYMLASAVLCVVMAGAAIQLTRLLI
jgi:CrcB protein